MVKMGGNAEVHGFRPCKWDVPWTFYFKNFKEEFYYERLKTSRPEGRAQHY